MKLIRFGQPDNEKPGIELQDGSRIDTSAFGEDYTGQFLASGGVNRLATWLKSNQASCPVIKSSERLGPPVAGTSKIVCIGLNYSDHAAESGMQLPPEPVIFFKSTTAICGPNDNLVIPRNSI